MSDLFERPILSICIPTYNRSQLMQQGLQMILSQIDEDLAPLVEIVISNNASTDSTLEVIQDLKIHWAHVQLNVYCQSNRISAAENVYFTYKYARGDFILLLSDDDILLPGGLRRIINAIQLQPYLDALCPNIRLFVQDMEDLGSEAYDLTEDRLINNKDEVIVIIGPMLTFLSCLIFRRELVADIDYTECLSSNIPHSYMFLDTLKHENGCLIIKNTCIAMRANDVVNYNLLEVFISNYINLINRAKQLGYSSSTRSQMLTEQLKFVSGVVYHFKQKGTHHQSIPSIAECVWRLLPVFPLDPVNSLRVMKNILLPA